MTDAVILLGGYTKGKRFRPLSIDLPKPLFLIGGRRVIHYHLTALADLGTVRNVYLIGLDEKSKFSTFISECQQEFNFKSITYLQEEYPLNTGGGLFRFQSTILKDDPELVLLMHGDICSSFPLREIVDFHNQHDGIVTLMATNVANEPSTKFGNIILDPATSEMLHFIEKPSKQVSDLINGGVYLFSRELFTRFAHLNYNDDLK